jgi:hypothetical protein
VSDSTIDNIRRRNGFDPAPVRVKTQPGDDFCRRIGTR